MALPYEPAHLCSLISTFGVCCLDSIILIISSLCLASVAAQAGLSLPWSQIPKTRFSHDVAHTIMHLKGADGMAHSVDPDQTAPPV